MTHPTALQRLGARGLLALVLAAAVLAACGKGKDDEHAAQTAGPVAVSMRTLAVRSVPIIAEFTGRIDAKSTVELRARTTGFLKQILFQEGSLVKAGDLLFVIDPAEQEKTLARGSAELRRVQAQLAKAQKDRGRFETLVKQDAVSAQEYDQKYTDERALAAQVEEARAAVEQARLNVSYTRIFAPQAGRIGKSSFKVGSLVGPGENSLLAEISSTDQMYVYFNVSEREYLSFTREIIEEKKQGEALSAYNATLVLADDSVYPAAGRLDMIDRSIDAQTGTLSVRAVFPNPDGLLKPGLFAKVRVHVGQKDNAVLLPQQAVSDVQGLKSVFVVKDGRAEGRTVTLGTRFESSFIVEQGLSPGETVIVDGWQKVKPGAAVVAAPAAPAAAPAK